MADAATYEAMATDALQAEFVRLAPILADVTEQRRLISVELERRLRQASAKVRLGALDQGERDALRTELAADSVAVAAPVTVAPTTP